MLPKIQSHKHFENVIAEISISSQFTTIRYYKIANPILKKTSTKSKGAIHPSPKIIEINDLIIKSVQHLPLTSTWPSPQIFY